MISDVVAFFVYYVFGYRKKVIYTNLKLAFPEKSEEERHRIRKKFYCHFIDIFMEMIKSFTISEKELMRRYQFTNIELVNSIEKEGKSMILVGSHYANWEWIFILNSYVTCKGVASYRRINNKYFDKKIRSSRGRFRTKLVETKDVITLIAENAKNNIQTLYGFLNDQSPQLKKTKYWSDFFGIRVPMQTGSEFLSKKHDLPIFMIKTKKVKRGYFESEFVLLAKNPRDFKDYELTDKYTKELEGLIREKPEHYFWSHRRFKHRGKEV